MEIVVALFFVFFALAVRRLRKDEARTTITVGRSGVMLATVEARLNGSLATSDSIDAKQAQIRLTADATNRQLIDNSYISRCKYHLSLFADIDAITELIAMYGTEIVIAKHRGTWVVAADIPVKQLSFRQRNQLNSVH